MGRRKRVAILVGQADEYYQAEFICGFEKQAFSYDWDVCVFSMYQKYQSSTEREQGETSIFSLVPYEDLDGIVMMLDTLQTPGLADSIEQAAHERAKCPVISVDKKSKYFFSIFPNHYEGVKQMVNHLIEVHGFKDIAFLTGKAWHPYSKERMQAYKDAMSAHGLTIQPNRQFYGDFWYTSGENLGDRLAKNKDELPEAIACANDCMAIGVCKGLTDNGIRVPEDIAVVGYDSNEEGRLSPVPLTSVRLPAGAFGKHAAESLFTMSEGKDPEPFACPGDVFIGRSCGCGMKAEDCVLALRDRWDTHTSSNSVFSNFNHLEDDILAKNDLYGIISTLFTYVYQLREFESFNLCINDGWEHYGTNADDTLLDEDSSIPAKFSTEKHIDYDFLSESGRFYSPRMAEVMSCRPEKLNRDRIGLDQFFERDRLIPRLDEERTAPEAFIFTPLHFDYRCFGYSVISFTEPASYSDTYRIWLRGVMRGLETLRRETILMERNEKLESSLIRDPLTGLYNYRGFNQKVDGLLNMYKGKGIDDIAAIAVDLRNLSEINDKDGRAAGDRAIIFLGRFMQEAFPEGYVFSFGNGEIVVISAALEDGKKKIEDAISEVRVKLSEYAGAQNYTVPLDIYYGLAQGKPQDRNEFERVASVAVTNKNAYKLRIRSLGGEPGSEIDSKQQADLVNDILDQNKIKYHFQPIVDAHTGEIFAYEALMRVDVTPYIQPLIVLKYAGLFGRLYDVEAATFRNILNIIAEQSDDFYEGSKVFINSIPGQHLKGEDFNNLITMTRQIGNRVVVEFTEQDELGGDELADLKQNYKDIGVDIAIDDYGTGYSNVSNLLRYMPKYLKIDRSLISEIQSSPQKQHFVREIITFSHDNGIKVLAEGVETQEELAASIHLGVDLIQGYYTGRPSAKIVKEIDQNIRDEIIRYNRLEKDEHNKSVYVAGREARVQLQSLISGDIKSIRVTNGEVTFRDITITGIPGVTSRISLNIDDGYSGRIMLENVHFSGKDKKAAILIGDGCDITLVLKGENILDSGGILVPATSNLVVEGDGNLSITVNDIESFGIGNDPISRAGNMVFDQDGTIEVSLNASRGICIGGGLGAGITTKRGRYFLKMTGQLGIGIGTFNGDFKPDINNCLINLSSSMMTSVGIGSYEGNVDMHIEHLAFISDFKSNDVSVIGTIRNARNKTDIYSVTFQSRYNATSGIMFGPLDVSPSDIHLKNATIRTDCEGRQVSLFRGTDENTVLSITECSLDGKIESSQPVPLDLEAIKFEHSKVGVMIDLNGEALYRGTY